ncbi:MAG: hypothetical protein QOF89_5248 [Acidobacteriota bacterium]|jgi:hypothetical protein|nr:hypothetical protein [Acidobacteriota bacterium]
MEFIVGHFYKREQIQSELGGEIQSYLPQRDKRIVAGCFGRRLNPDAPLEVQAGSEPKVVQKAEMLAAQADKRIPVFLKGKPERPCAATWQYQGVYELCELVDNDAALKIAETRSGRHGDLSYLLRFRAVEE